MTSIISVGDKEKEFFIHLTQIQTQIHRQRHRAHPVHRIHRLMVLKQPVHRILLTHHKHRKQERKVIPRILIHRMYITDIDIALTDAQDHHQLHLILLIHLLQTTHSTSGGN